LKVLLIGSGGREHALASALIRDTTVEQLHVAPGNPGIAGIAICHPVDIRENKAILELAKKLSVDLVVIGPEGPLVNALADELRS
jgi:phosphoribosylamine---glycine ligase